jgi:phage terminase large subunit GpA-like protein
MTALAILQSAAEILRPPRRIPVSQAAGQYLQIHRPGGHSGPWDPDLTPYMTEPMDRLSDRSIEAVIFVGPARTGKSAGLVLGWLTYAVVCDPGDFLMLHMTEATARDFSKDDVARAHRHSPELKERLSPYANSDNVFDKQYRHGMRLLIGWPSISQLSGRTLRYVAITDYDRMAANIDGEGDAFSLARKRVQTFLSGGRVMVESSPGWLIDDPKWTYEDPHAAPPCKGIFSLYAQGDRRRWYWPCPECGEYFTAAPTIDALVDIEGDIHLICPVCGSAIHPRKKTAMNRAGRWLAAGQTIAADGTITGDPLPSRIASYWLTGPAAAYQSWQSLWTKHHAAQADLEKTGSEESLKATTTGDFGIAYRPRQLHIIRDPRALQSRAEDVQKRTVPPEVKFLTAAVDVQKNRFVVQVVGWGISGERWLIDRYNLRQARRRAGSDDWEGVDPAGRIEDWLLIATNVIKKPYPFAADETHGLTPLMTAIDSGGQAGVTERAYLFWRQLRGAGLANKAMLVKGKGGDAAKTGPRIKITYPDSSKRVQQRRTNARGEIPVWLLNTLVLKDSVAADMERPESGPGYIHWPAWMGAWFFDELTAETRTAKGWENLGGARNEAFDLMVYNTAAWLRLKADLIDWANPPAWAIPQRQAVPIQTAPEPEKAPEKAAPAPKPIRQTGGGSFINRPSGQPWMRR